MSGEKMLQKLLTLRKLRKFKVAKGGQIRLKCTYLNKNIAIYHITTKNARNVNKSGEWKV